MSRLERFYGRILGTRSVVPFAPGYYEKTITGKGLKK